MRDVTERPEAVDAGVVKLVGTAPTRIVDAVNAALAQPPHSTHFDPDASPYGDGRASARIVAALRGHPLPEFATGHRAGLAPSPLQEVTP
ncbi:UDP-N-acetylglucosamine 2-epimerase [compost metagenome]